MAVSSRTLMRRVVAPADRRCGMLAALDFGAGIVWLSSHLADAGHRPVAIDLMSDERDCLGAARRRRAAMRA